MVTNAECNVLFVTLDSCSYDCFQCADLPFLKGFASWACASTHGTYTLPAHMSFFMGYLPSGISEPSSPWLTPEVKQLWRLSSARRKASSSIEISLSGKNVVDGYRNLGFRSQGYGGVRWFRHPALYSLFDSFKHFGVTDQESVFAPRAPEEFPLNHIDEIISSCSGRDFLFVNCPETHCPYDTGVDDYSVEERYWLGRGEHLWGGAKLRLSGAGLGIDELASLRHRQVLALEAVDRKLSDLVRALPKPLLLVVCGDHGEAFGEDSIWGHGIAINKVMHVPLVIAFVE